MFISQELANLLKAAKPFTELLEDEHPKGTIFKLEVHADDVQALKDAYWAMIEKIEKNEQRMAEHRKKLPAPKEIVKTIIGSYIPEFVSIDFISQQFFLLSDEVHLNGQSVASICQELVDEGHLKTNEKGQFAAVLESYR